MKNPTQLSDSPTGEKKKGRRGQKPLFPSALPNKGRTTCLRCITKLKYNASTDARFCIKCYNYLTEKKLL